MLIIILFIILLIIYILSNTNKLDNFENNYKNRNKNYKVLDKKTYPYNPVIQTPQINYDKIISKIDSQQKYKKDLSISLSPIPTINCHELSNKKDCNKYGCNWFGTMCSSTYPIDF